MPYMAQLRSTPERSALTGVGASAVGIGKPGVHGSKTCFCAVADKDKDESKFHYRRVEPVCNCDKRCPVERIPGLAKDVTAA